MRTATIKCLRNACNVVVSSPGCFNCSVYSIPSVSLDVEWVPWTVGYPYLLILNCIGQSWPLNAAWMRDNRFTLLIRKRAYGHFQQVFSPQGLESPYKNWRSASHCRQPVKLPSCALWMDVRPPRLPNTRTCARTHFRVTCCINIEHTTSVFSNPDNGSIKPFTLHYMVPHPTRQ
jgi:hypothetical protein